MRRERRRETTSVTAVDDAALEGTRDKSQSLLLAGNTPVSTTAGAAVLPPSLLPSQTKAPATDTCQDTTVHTVQHSTNKISQHTQCYFTTHSLRTVSSSKSTIQFHTYRHVFHSLSIPPRPSHAATPH
mgnify:FL=1